MNEHEKGKPRKSLLRRMISSIITIILGVIVGFGVLIFFLQNSMIYHGAPYEPGEVEAYESSSRVVRLPFETDQGKQEAYFIVRGQQLENANPIPDRIWLVFGGNASLALDWVDFLALYRGSSAGFLLIDYPGYGNCAGDPSPSSILESTKGAVAALGQHLNWSEVQLSSRFSVLGQSLGAAAGLQAATFYKVHRVVLVSPFTRMLDMARRTTGPLHCHLLRHRWDNIARLEEMAQFTPLPRVSIIHGSDDQVVPVGMGRALGERFRNFVDFTEIAGFGHNDISYGASEDILDAVALEMK
ncbi:MAG: alpha/beta hydrolase [Verrucomicrobiae bacterium]|nr:alpha/beta hydrolase [Verrucomicrobiae bacterium]